MVATGSADARTVRVVIDKLNAQGLGPVDLPLDCDDNALGEALASELGAQAPDGPREYVVRLRWCDSYGQRSDETETTVAHSPMDAARRCFMSLSKRVDMPRWSNAWVDGQAFELYRADAVHSAPCDEPEPER